MNAKTLKSATLHDHYQISYWERPSPGGRYIVFIHGFGSCKEHFRFAAQAPSLAEFTLLAPDLIGFGQSSGPEEFSYAMQDQAALMLELLDQLQVENFHLCGHSMGGLVVMNMAELAPQRVWSLMDLEGNLTPEDCTFSGRVNAYSLTEFSENGRTSFEKELEQAGDSDPSSAEYVESFRVASTVALYKSARHTVLDSSLPLVNRLSRIPNVCYLYGEKNRGIYPGEKLLHAAGIPVFYIPDAGHAMATDNPTQLYALLGSFIEGLPQH